MDWSTMLTRRAKKDPVDQGGWNLLHTWATGADLISPMTHFFIAANCDKAWFGWYCDPKVEELREQWARSADATRQKQLGEAIQRQVYATAGYYPLGQFVLPTAYNARLSGVIVSPVAIFWNIQKK
jgi:peptide/nickel transport system substrate-binding protein